MTKKSRTPRRRTANASAPQTADAIEILPALPDNPDRPEKLELDGNLPPELEFAPVTTKSGRQKFVPELQRKFIQALSITGSATLSARAVGMSIGQVYGIKNGPRAQSLGEAWEKAIRMGAVRVRDTIIDHAINGTPEYFYKDGQLVGERRHFNLRAMQWVVTHVMPMLGEGAGGLAAFGSLPQSLQKLKEQWHSEWEEDAATRAAEAQAEEAAAYNSAEASKARFLKKYQAKVREEYFFRAEGNAIAADFALRQLAMMEVIMDVGGITKELIQQHFFDAPQGGPWSTEISRALEEARHTAWTQCTHAEGEAYPPTERPLRPFYYDAAMMEADAAARNQLTKTSSNSDRERREAEAEWRRNRPEGSEKPEGDTFLPKG